MPIVAYVLFFLSGLAFGFAAPGKVKLLPLVFPLLLALGAMLVNGADAAVVLRLVVALVITLLGIGLGLMIDQRSRRREEAAAA